MTTCGGPVINDPDDTFDYTNVIYSPETGTMTLYLDGYVPVTNRQNRALSQQLAQMGHNFFEVVFIYGGGDVVPRRVNRLSWAWGETARTSELYRTDAPGINYGGITPTPATGAGSALLFVGTSADKTLLAVGRLTYVDNGDGNVPGTSISTATKSVTFSVQSLEAGLIDPTDPLQVPPDYSTNPDAVISAAYSSFWTGAKGIGTPNPYLSESAANTWVELKTVGPLQIPYYRLKGTSIADGHIIPGNQFSASYTFYGIEDYVAAAAIRVAENGEAHKKQPRFSLNEGPIFNPPGDLDTHTSVTMQNNRAGEAFNNEVEFLITPTSDTHDGMLFALVFAVPVYALTADDDNVNGTSAIKWNIRPGFGTFMYDLDTGRDDGGGAILMGTDVPEPDPQDVAGIVVIMPPKTYGYLNTPDNTGNYPGLIFGIDGLEVGLEDSNGTIHVGVIDPEADLKYYIGDNEIFIGEPISSSLNGMMPVTVVYTEGLNSYTATFYIIVGDEARLRMRVRYVANNIYGGAIPANDHWTRINDTAFNVGTQQFRNATLVLIVVANTNVPIQQNINGVERNVIIVAGEEGVIIGREGTASSSSQLPGTSDGLGTFLMDRSNSMFTYMGKWPFNAPIIDTFVADPSDPTTAGDQGGGNYTHQEPSTGVYERYDGYGKTYDFSVNTMGRWQDYATSTVPASAYMPQYMFRTIFNIWSGAIVWMGEGLRLTYEPMLYNH